MSKPKITDSASLHLKIGACTAGFSGVFLTLTTCFPPVTAFVLAVFVVITSSKV
jgi:hypothetical protein